MRNLLLTVALCIVSLAACDCTTTKFYPSGVTNQVSAEFKAEQTQDQRSQNQQLMEHIKDRTVLITVDCTPKKGVVILGTANPDKYGDGWGTGIIVRSKENKSYLFTASHVVEFSNSKDAEHFDCDISIQRAEDAGHNRNKIKASIVVKNTVRDIAVLSVDVNLGVNTDLEIDPFTGEDVWAAGFPVQKSSAKSQLLSITKGALATKLVPMNGNAKKNGHYHRVTAQVYFGNSGGGVWNKQGKLISIVSSLYAGAGGIPYEGYYYTKPVTEVLKMLSKENRYQEVFGGTN
jgi:S1-C subfamily serine protease